MAAGTDRTGDGTELMSDAMFADWLRRRVEDHNPAAVVRFGDGESRMLAADPGDADSMREGVGKLRKETGLSFSADVVLAVKALVELAFDRADVLCIRYLAVFSDEGKMWMKKLAVRYAERVATGGPPTALAYCGIHSYMLEALPGLLTGRRISVVSCRDLKPVLETEWGLEDVGVYQVPSQHLARDVDGAYEAAMHDVPIYPDAHHDILSRLAVRERGEVFLVGAGVFGKDLCIHIRDRGGIALDMGSTLDQLAGKITRGPERRARKLYESGMSVEEIVAEFQHAVGDRVEHDDLVSMVTDAIGEEP